MEQTKQFRQSDHTGCLRPCTLCGEEVLYAEMRSGEALMLDPYGEVFYPRGVDVPKRGRATLQVMKGGGYARHFCKR